MSRLPAFACLLLLPACVKTVNPAPLPVAGVAMQTWSEEVREPRARDIFMRNDSDHEIVITSVQLYNCRNLKQVCKAYETSVVIPAGKTVKAMRLEPENLKLSWSYNYNYQMRHNGARVIRDSFTVVMPSSPVTAKQLARAADFVPAVEPNASGPICSTQNPVPGPDGTTGLLMVFGTRNDDLRHVTVYRRGDSISQVVDGRNGPDGKRTSITTLFDRRLALVMNRIVGNPPEAFTISGADVLTARSLGDPTSLANMVVAECGKR